LKSSARWLDAHREEALRLDKPADPVQHVIRGHIEEAPAAEVNGGIHHDAQLAHLVADAA